MLNVLPLCIPTFAVEMIAKKKWANLNSLKKILNINTFMSSCHMAPSYSTEVKNRNTKYLYVVTILYIH